MLLNLIAKIWSKEVYNKKLITMKNSVKLFVFLFLISITVGAQQRGERGNQFTPEQKATLQVKKMTLLLDLNKSQQDAIYTLAKNNALMRETMRANFQERRKNGTRPTSDERYQQSKLRLNKQIAHKAAMKKILTKAQFEKWEKNMQNGKKRMGKAAKMKKGKKQKRRQF